MSSIGYFCCPAGKPNAHLVTVAVDNGSLEELGQDEDERMWWGREAFTADWKNPQERRYSCKQSRKRDTHPQLREVTFSQMTVPLQSRVPAGRRPPGEVAEGQCPGIPSLYCSGLQLGFSCTSVGYAHVNQKPLQPPVGCPCGPCEAGQELGCFHSFLQPRILPAHCPPHS